MLVGGEDLPKVSTQALKQQYEKTIEEAASAKEIKVMMPPLYLDASLGFSLDDGITSWNHHMQITPAAGGLRISFFHSVKKKMTAPNESPWLWMSNF